MGLQKPNSKDKPRAVDPRLEDALLDVAPLAALKRPSKGWIHAIRTAKGLTARELAQQIEMTVGGLNALEQSEVKGGIKLNTLRRLASEMDCALVYAIVPNELVRSSDDKAAALPILRPKKRLADAQPYPKVQDVPAGSFRIGEWVFEPRNGPRLSGPRDVIVSEARYRVLMELVREAGHFVPAHMLAERIWPKAPHSRINYLQVIVHGLRALIEPEPAHPRFLISLRGSGYKLLCESVGS